MKIIHPGKYRIPAVVLSSFLVVSIITGQSRIGEWQSQLPYTMVNRIEKVGDRIYCGTETGLFYFNKGDNSINIISREDGLSEVEVNTIGYNTELDILLVGYKNANIDLIQGTGIINMPDIERKQITGNKIINNVLFIGHYAYLSCGFGIVVLNLDKYEVKDTYYIGENGAYTNIHEIAFDGQFLYAATESGIFRADIDNPNLIDFNNWSRINDLPDPDGEFNSIVFYDGRIFTNYSNNSGGIDVVYYYSNGSWNPFNTVINGINSNLTVCGDRLVIVSDFITQVYDYQGNLTHGIWSEYPQHAIIDEEDILWIGDGSDGMFKIKVGGEKEYIYPDGPLSNRSVSSVVVDQKLYSVAGAVTSGWNNSFIPGELNIYKNGFWEGNKSADYRDLIDVAVDPANSGHVFAASWGYGLVEFNNGELVKTFGLDNMEEHSLQTIIPGGDFFRIGGIAFDRYNNLWMTNTDVPRPISVRKSDGSWTSFEAGGNLKYNALSRIMVTSYDHKWVLIPKGHGLFAFDINNTIDNISDDRYREFDIRDVNNKIITNNVYSFAEDHEGNIWIGTDKGIVVYYSPTRVFDNSNFYGQQIIVPRNDGSGLADILLGTETVTAIAVDGANRKWLGTQKAGVFLVSDDGLELVYNFTSENSPLFSNNISNIAIDGKSGKVFFGTDKGIISFKSTATDGGDSFKDVYAYPNPVREDYHGDIVITGLVENVNVKITDIAGNIVYETTSLGGQAIWNGKSFSGDRVSTGIYLIFCTDEEGTKTHITKLMVIN